MKQITVLMLIFLLMMPVVGTAQDDPPTEPLSANGVELRYPTGWYAEANGEFIVIATSQAAVEASGAPPGEIVIGVAVIPELPALLPNALRPASVGVYLMPVFSGAAPDSAIIEARTPGDTLMAWGDTTYAADDGDQLLRSFVAIVPAGRLLYGYTFAHPDDMEGFMPTLMAIVDSVTLYDAAIFDVLTPPTVNLDVADLPTLAGAFASESSDFSIAVPTEWEINEAFMDNPNFMRLHFAWGAEEQVLEGNLSLIMGPPYFEGMFPAVLQPADALAVLRITALADAFNQGSSADGTVVGFSDLIEAEVLGMPAVYYTLADDDSHHLNLVATRDDGALVMIDLDLFQPEAYALDDFVPTLLAMLTTLEITG